MGRVRTAERDARLRLIAEILRTQAISSQDELSAILLQRGYQRAQQLIHRDLTAVGAIKITYRGKTRWVMKDLGKWDARDGTGQCEQCAVAWYIAGIEDAERWGSK